MRPTKNAPKALGTHANKWAMAKDRAVSMTFSAEHMMDNAATASQHLPLLDDPVVRGAVLRSVAQYIELNWHCTSQNLLDALREHPDFNL